MRTAHSIRNIEVSSALNIATTLLGFMSRTVFIKILGSDYLGINGVGGKRYN